MPLSGLFVSFLDDQELGVAEIVEAHSKGTMAASQELAHALRKTCVAGVALGRPHTRLTHADRPLFSRRCWTPGVWNHGHRC